VQETSELLSALPVKCSRYLPRNCTSSWRVSRH